MQQPSFAHGKHRLPGAGTLPVATEERCATISVGEVRPYAPFGLLHCGAGLGTAQGKRDETEQEQRGRTGLAA